MHLTESRRSSALRSGDRKRTEPNWYQKSTVRFGLSYVCVSCAIKLEEKERKTKTNSNNKYKGKNESAFALCYLKFVDTDSTRCAAQLSAFLLLVFTA